MCCDFSGSFKNTTGAGTGCIGPWIAGPDAQLRYYCYSAVLEDYQTGEGWVSHDSDNWTTANGGVTQFKAKVRSGPGVYQEYYLTALCGGQWKYCTVSHTGQPATTKTCNLNHTTVESCTQIGVSLKYIDSPTLYNGVVDEFRVEYFPTGIPTPTATQRVTPGGCTPGVNC
jgi:hypothetical protein